MKMKPFPWKCGTCRERAVAPTVLPNYVADLEHDGRKYRITLDNFPVLRCSRCGAIMLDDEASRKLSDALRTEAGLLLPSEIRKNREALGLTQKELAGYLLIAESTLSRWETGAQIQQRSMDAFLRGFFQVQELRSFLGATEPGRYGFIEQPFTMESSKYSWTPARNPQSRILFGPTQAATQVNLQGGPSRHDPGIAA